MLRSNYGLFKTSAGSGRMEAADESLSVEVLD